VTAPRALRCLHMGSACDREWRYYYYYLREEAKLT